MPKTKIVLAILVGASLLVLGTAWAFASPHGSSADDDFHLTSIWCSHGESDFCRTSAEGPGVLVPRVIAYPSCYVTWPASRSAGCLEDVGYERIYTERRDPPSGGYPDGFHWVMGFFAGQDVPASVQLMRLLNVAIASGFLLYAILVLQPGIRRAVAVSWSVGVIPLGIFFIASTNPSSWAITGVGLYWAFLLSVLRDARPRRGIFWARLMGMLSSAVLALLARSDSSVYLAASTLALLLLAFPTLQTRVKTVVLFGCAGLAGLVLIGFYALRDRYLAMSMSWPGAQTATDQPNPILKTIMEIPSFFVGLLGGQRPSYVLSDSGVNQGVDGYRPTGLLYGLGWTDVQLPSAVAISGVVAAVVIATAGLNSYRRTRLLALFFLASSAIGQILIMRAMVDFVSFWEIQPRYFVPIFIVILGVLALRSEPQKRLLTGAQACIVMFCLVVGGSVAWMTTAARYAIGPDASFTNFGQTADWWWELGPSRLVWFLIVVGATGLWAVATVWNFGARPIVSNRRSDAGVVASG